MSALQSALEVEPDLTPAAKELLSTCGLMNSLADLLERFKCGGDRDEIAAMNGEHKTIKLAAEVLNNLLTHQASVVTAQRLAAIEAQLGRRDAGGTTSFDEFDPPEAESSGAN